MSTKYACAHDDSPIPPRAARRASAVPMLWCIGVNLFCALGLLTRKVDKEQHVHTYAYAHAYEYTRVTYTFLHTCRHTYTHICLHTHVYAHARLHTHVYTHTLHHTYVYAHTSTHTHLYTHTSKYHGVCVDPLRTLPYLKLMRWGRLLR